MPTDLFGSELLYTGVRAAIGGALEEGIPVTLGWIDSSDAIQLKVDPNTNDGVQKFYYTIGDQPPGEAHNMGPNPLDPKFLKVGAPVYVSRAKTGRREWYIDGLQPGLAEEFFGGRDAQAPTPIYLNQFVPGLVNETAPPSMRVVVFGAPYSLNGEFKWIGTKYSADFTAEVPATAGQALYALVEVDFTNDAISIQYGEEFDAGLTHQQTWAADGGSGTLFPQPDRAKFRAGYVKLVSGMTAIRRAHIWAVQEIYTKIDYTDILIACGEVVTVDGEVATV